MTTTQPQFAALQQAMNARHFERQDEIDIALIALLCGYHVAYVGPPGTAKSMLADDITNAIVGARLFDILMMKTTTPEEVFGPLSIPAYKEGRFERIIEGTLVDCEIAWCDEVFKANSAILNSMLKAMNERRFRQGPTMIDIPLLTLFGASNELPEGEELGALFDRFHFRKLVDYIHEPTNFVSMLLSAENGDLPEVTLDELTQAQGEVLDVEIPDNIFDTMILIRSDMSMEGMVASDRRFKQSLRAIRARAWLDGRDTVNDNDFWVLQHMLWAAPAEIKPVKRIVLDHTNPLELRAQEIIDQTDEIAGQLAAGLLDARRSGGTDLTKQGIEWFTRLRQLGEELKQLDRQAQREQRTTSTITTAKNRVLRVAKEVGQRCIGLDTEINMSVD